MKSFASIDYYGDYWGLPVIAFDKLDGSNFRAEFSQKRGFYKFGTRNQMIDHTSEPFGFAIQLFLNKYEVKLTEIFKSKSYRNIQSFVCYAELIAPDSRFGQHDFTDKSKFDIVLFDIDQHKNGFIEPRQFIKDFQHLGIPEIIYEGNLSYEFIQNVKNNVYNLQEGVIIKGKINNQKHRNLYYCKAKTNEWLNTLKSRYIDLYNKEIKEFKE